MRVIRANIPDVVVLEPKVFQDARGFFLESYSRRSFLEATGVDIDFVQDNHSRSGAGVLRGLHYQIERAQGKLVRVTLGEIWDVAVDLRRSAPTFGKWTATPLSAELKNVIWIPPGFAHGFLVLSQEAEVQYKTTDYYAPEHERTLLWRDSSLAIPWPLAGEPILSDKDRVGKPLREAETYP